MDNEVRYYFFYLEIPELDIESSGIIEITKDNMIEVFIDIKKDIIQSLSVPEKMIALKDIVIKQFNRL